MNQEPTINVDMDILLLFYQMTKDVESHVRMGRLDFVEFPASDRKKYGATVSSHYSKTS